MYTEAFNSGSHPANENNLVGLMLAVVLAIKDTGRQEDHSFNITPQLSAILPFLNKVS